MRQHLLWGFGTMSLFGGGKIVQDKNGNPNPPQENKLFFPNLNKLHNLHILMDFYEGNKSKVTEYEAPLSGAGLHFLPTVARRARNRKKHSSLNMLRDYSGRELGC
jgi:hypothetical protein